MDGLVDVAEFTRAQLFAQVEVLDCEFLGGGVFLEWLAFLNIVDLDCWNLVLRTISGRLLLNHIRRRCLNNLHKRTLIHLILLHLIRRVHNRRRSHLPNLLGVKKRIHLFTLLYGNLLTFDWGSQVVFDDNRGCDLAGFLGLLVQVIRVPAKA